MLDGDPHDNGTIPVAAGGPIFQSAHTFFLKDTTDLALSGNAKSLLTYKGVNVLATAKYGKGTVFAVVDPWLYNEYTDGRKLPYSEFDNYAGGWEVVRWLLHQVPAAPRSAVNSAAHSAANSAP